MLSIPKEYKYYAIWLVLPEWDLELAMYFATYISTTADESYWLLTLGNYFIATFLPPFDPNHTIAIPPLNNNIIIQILFITFPIDDASNMFMDFYSHIATFQYQSVISLFY